MVPCCLTTMGMRVTPAVAHQGTVGRVMQAVRSTPVLSLPIAVLLALSTQLGAAATPAQAQGVAATAGASAANAQALLSRFCVTCHNPRTLRGGLTLDGVDLAAVGSHPDIWERVVRKLRAGTMPPRGRPRPDTPAVASLVAWLEHELDQAAAVRPDPGRTEPLHRLNRTEYRNTVRDLLGLDVDVSALLPSDDSSYGFDNMAGVQRMSPTLLERYLSAAHTVSRLAVGANVSPRTETVRISDTVGQNDRLDGLPFGTRGGTLIRYAFPSDGEYTIRVQLARLGGSSTGDLPRFTEPQPLEISVDGEPVAQFTAPPAQGRRGGPKLDANWVVRFAAKAGPRDVAVTFLNRSPALLENLVEPFLRPWPGGSGRYTTRNGAYLRSVEISGPFNATGPGDTPSRRRIFICQPTQIAEERGCAEAILLTLGRRAYRRPVTPDEIEPLMRFYTQGRSEGSFDTGIERAVEALLVSPQFLFRIEHDPEGIAPGGVYRVSDLELASRLSFFIWSSIPDDELIDLAVEGKLRDPAALDQQVRRMLADRRSEALVTSFAAQWLLLRNLAALAPDPKLDPDFDDGLRRAFRRETELLLESVMREDRSVLDLLTADYTFLNERLARHYGIRGVRGAHFRRVTLEDEQRRGLLGHGSILTVTAFPNRTSPVLRGKWVLENVLGAPPPDPPPDVPALEDSSPDPTASMRERIAQHRANPVCASCHNVMDPIGLSLETFDFLGRRRTVDGSGMPIDATGALPDGTEYDGLTGLRDALVEQPEQFVTTVIEKLLAYALGRGIEPADHVAIRRIRRDAAADDYWFSSLVRGIAASVPFQMRRAQS